jgi:hypothetical protein
MPVVDRGVGILPRQKPEGKMLKTSPNEITCILRTLVI